jgi:hypothetical protein
MPFRAEYPFLALDTADESPVLRPCLDVILRGPGGSELGASTPALIDSGADTSVFPIEFAESLGISLAACLREPFETAGGEAEELVWDDPVMALFDGQQVDLTASFEPTPVALLGREDFFVRYRVTIDQREQKFLLDAYQE